MGISSEGNTNEIADALAVKRANERRKGVTEDPRAFGLSRWKDGVAIIEIGKVMYRADLRVKSSFEGRELIWDILCLRYLLNITSGHIK